MKMSVGCGGFLESLSSVGASALQLLLLLSPSYWAVGQQRAAGPFRKHLLIFILGFSCVAGVASVFPLWPLSVLPCFLVPTHTRRRLWIDIMITLLLLFMTCSANYQPESRNLGYPFSPVWT